jgi:acyl-CoA hydrolase
MKDRIALRFLAAPGDAVANGSTVRAGSVLEWIDKAGYACTVGWSASACVTRLRRERTLSSADPSR